MTSPGRDQRTAAQPLSRSPRLRASPAATVSRVVNGSPRVSGDVRRDVEAAVNELGYVPNRAARSLVTRRSDSIGVVIAEPSGRRVHGPVLPAAAPRDQRRRSPRATCSSSSSCRRPRARRTGRPTTSPPATSTARSSSASTTTTPSPADRRAGIPMVVSPRPRRPMSVSYVDVDNRGGANRAVAHLVRPGPAGHRDGRRPVRTWSPASTASPATATPCSTRGLALDPALEAVARLHPGRRRDGDGAPARPSARTSTPSSPPPT